MPASSTALKCHHFVNFVLLGTAFVAAIALAGCDSFTSNGHAALEITVRPGDNLQQVVQSSQEGTVFRLTPGVYRLQNMSPKDNQQFIGEEGAILSGAQILSDWQREDGYWVAKVAQERLPPHGECENEQELCKFREDLFVDGKLYQPVASKERIGSAQWYRADEKVFLSDDPTHKRVEMSTLPWAINGAAKGLLLKNLVVEKYASAAQSGAIDGRDGENWKLVDIVARWNHGVGLYIGKGMQVIRGSFSSNGQLGIGGEGDHAVIDGAEVAANNYAGFSIDWEAGGTKFVRSSDLVVRNTCVHDNAGPGLWTDIDNVDVTYLNNKVFRNSGDGIKHEISYRASIVKNLVAQNGKGKDAWLWGSQILVQNSSNVDVRDNTVEVAPDFGNGISIVYQDRGDGPLGNYDAKGNYIHQNTIIHLGEHGHSGLVADANIEEFWKSNDNRFDANTYMLAGRKDSIFAVDNYFASLDVARAQGFELNGKIESNGREPISLVCK
jgi:hypothetical protein